LTSHHSYNPLENAGITLTPNTTKKDSCFIRDQKFIQTLDPIQKSILTIGNDLNRFMKVHETTSLAHNIQNLNMVHSIISNMLKPYTDKHDFDVPNEIVYE
jgi:hypothetical protein